ncbi:MAG: right-handed parallel beta-helix repeat-containing protein [Candidatus Bathyarchaeota archaeon]|nr:right-handed parallel beta-helix repeat-containing protein [Candidatus Bathyarchaeum sp.]
MVLTKKTVTFIALLFCFMFVLVAQTCVAQQIETKIRIQQNGKLEFLEPKGEYLNMEITDLIQRDSDEYWFASNISVPLVVERSNILIDGRGFTLKGQWTGNAVNLTTSNVTVKNLHITGWDVGILGVFDNNTLTNNYITSCNYGMSLTADKYCIVSNYVANNGEGISLNSGTESNYIAQNLVTNNTIGLSLIGYASDATNTIEENVISYNQKGIYVWWHRDRLVQKIYRNDFIENEIQVTIAGASPIFGLDPSSSWNNGSGEGNYWSDYEGTDSDDDGIGDTPYNVTYANTDIYPLMSPVDAEVVPEFGSWVVVPVALGVSLFVVAYKKRQHRQ